MKDISPYIFKLAIGEDSISKAMVSILNDYNISVKDDIALKLFYSIIINIIYHLDSHPGQYFKLKYIDIVSEADNMLCIKPGADFSKDMISAKMLYDKYSSTSVLKEEIQKSIDLFAQTYLDIREDKQKEIRKIDKIIAERKRLLLESRKCTEISKMTKKYKKSTLKKREAENKKLKTYLKRKIKSAFINNIELQNREKSRANYELLEKNLKQKWMDGDFTLPFKK